MLQKIASILIGSIFIGIGVNYFVIPNHLIDGGIIGLGLISKYTLGLKPGLTIIVLSLPLYVYAWFRFRTYFYNGLHGLLVSSLLIDYFHPLSSWHTAPILISAISGGFLIGTGIGIMMLTKTSTGGIDLLALMIARVTSFNVGVIIFIIDSIVILFGWLIIQEATIIYSSLMVIMIGVTTFTITDYFGRVKESS
ncbi:YitT family protein [Virgibacillus doumboii]|uniref:YitT family protein n=1 Tax=Virgibacillus doumboii TaxID=2697503 RepID=UPI0013E06A6C|nr:YitT family protein [Virgibacillus doumboii]